MTYISHNQSFYTKLILVHPLFGRARLGDTKAQVGLSFMYDAPPGAKQDHKVRGCFIACNLIITMLITKRVSVQSHVLLTSNLF